MNNRQQGTVVRWVSEKGFGFIRPEHRIDEIFFHIREYRGEQQPYVGEQVFFVLDVDKQGRPCAKNVQEFKFVQEKIAQQNHRQQQYQQRQSAREEKSNVLNVNVILASVFYFALAGYALLSKHAYGKYILMAYTICSVITFFLYWNDKNKAHNKEWRIPESTLHGWAVLGGWIGASFAHKLLNHKSSKAEFRMIYYATIVLNIIALIVFLKFFK